MQSTTQTRISQQTALKYGAIFGLLAGAIDVIIIALNIFSQFTSKIAFNLAQAGGISPDIAATFLEYALIAIALLITAILCFVAGYLAARETGITRTGLLTGLYAGLLFALIDTLCNLIIIFAITFPEISQGPAQGAAMVKAQLLTYTIEISLVVFALAAAIGAGVGFLGGNVGRKQSPVLPANYETYPPPNDPPC